VDFFFQKKPNWPNVTFESAPLRHDMASLGPRTPANSRLKGRHVSIEFADFIQSPVRQAFQPDVLLPCSLDVCVAASVADSRLGQCLFQFGQPVLGDLGVCDIQLPQLAEFCQMRHRGIGDRCAAKLQSAQILDTGQVLDPCIGDLDIAQDQRTQPAQLSPAAPFRRRSAGWP
jgi:hypothetical protein